MSKLIRFVLVSVAAWLLAGEAYASLQIVGPAYYTGSRTTVGTSSPAGGLVWNPADGKWSSGNFSIGWMITDNGADYTYKYTVNTPSTGDARLSHWILPLSATDLSGNSLQSHWESIFVSGTGYTDTGIGSIPSSEIKTHLSGGNPGKPADLYGVKFTRDSEVNTTIVEFTTGQVPVWGSFYAKDGGGSSGAVYAYNVGFGTDPADDATDFTNWIPRPDGVMRPIDPNEEPEIPEPFSLAVWSGLVMIGVGMSRRRS